MDLAVPADHKLKLKESEKKDKYLDLARDLKKKKLCYMQVTFIPIIIGDLGTVTKGFFKGTGGVGKKGDKWRPSKLLHY